ncbi:hypothetical protein J8273_3371 [Carpediemonas membranifera]|uniref:Uncharacterized protein n=1 Tax=Carpediemonas membranifera TaxID=201153 RepID=A0A8J6ASV6_9EUKA|nr:hypothetical protein J8273_3371 [Carpediemonas membranifera]|eukprot:KAG9393238.1 hypothetical protein J8273_3371 [Carpediemonas membranifera]
MQRVLLAGDVGGTFTRFNVTIGDKLVVKEQGAALPFGKDGMKAMLPHPTKKNSSLGITEAGSVLKLRHSTMSVAQLFVCPKPDCLAVLEEKLLIVDKAKHAHLYDLTTCEQVSEFRIPTNNVSDPLVIGANSTHLVYCTKAMGPAFIPIPSIISFGVHDRVKSIKPEVAFRLKPSLDARLSIDDLIQPTSILATDAAVLLGCRDGAVLYYALPHTDGRPQWKVELPVPVTSLAMHGDIVLAGSTRGRVSLINTTVAKPKEECALPDLSGAVAGIEMLSVGEAEATILTFGIGGRIFVHHVLLEHNKWRADSVLNEFARKRMTCGVLVAGIEATPGEAEEEEVDFGSGAVVGPRKMPETEPEKAADEDEEEDDEEFNL